MLPQWIIEKKRDNLPLGSDEIEFFIKGFTDGEIADYQAAALAMAIYFNGMTPDETASLTESMLHSGSVLDTSSINKPKIDKHSTGGIGDKVSLILAPLVACCGIADPMISGRGLGITGGTLDKLESIPGYRTDISKGEFLAIVEKCGCSIIGQTSEIAPADKRLYAIRDVTGTVPSIPLITASILSKKLAAGLDGLVMDVKYGCGAFMKTMEDAEKLADSILSTAARMNTPVTALITGMNQPLGRAAGNALEIAETIQTLKGEGPEDLTEITLELGAQMLIIGAVSETRENAVTRLKSALASGAAFETFKKMVGLHGGSTECVDNPGLLPKPELTHEIKAEVSGFVHAVDAEKTGRACLLLGAGRRNTEEKINHSVGISGIKKIGEPVDAGEPLAVIHAASEETLQTASSMAESAFTIRQAKPEKPELIHKIIGAEK